MSNYNGGVNNRRKRALKRLEVQAKALDTCIETNNKAIKENMVAAGKTDSVKTKALLKSDVANRSTAANIAMASLPRILHEIQTLKSRIK